MTMSSNRHEPIFDIHPVTDVGIEVFYADTSLISFGRSGAGWFWWPRRRGSSPDGPATGPFATSYAAYRHAMKDEIQFVDSAGWAPTRVGSVGGGGDRSSIETLCV
jgi:hypothetical protein